MEQNRSYAPILLAHVEPVTLAKAGSMGSVPIVCQVDFQAQQVTAHVISVKPENTLLRRNKATVHYTALAKAVLPVLQAAAPKTDVN
jgi:hypothetical protein